MSGTLTMMPAGRWVLTSGQWRLHLSHHHLLPLLMPVSQCLLPLHPALMPHLSTLLPPPVSPPPHTTDASGTVPPSSALRACVSQCDPDSSSSTISFIVYFLLDYWKEKVDDYCYDGK